MTWPTRLGVPAALIAVAVTLLAPRHSRAAVPGVMDAKMNLAFVLLPEAKLPKGEAIVRAFATYAVKGQSLRYRPEKQAKWKNKDEEVLVLEADGGQALVAFTPKPIPNGEAEEAVRYSISALGGKWKLPPHKAHLVVTLHSRGDAMTRLSLLTSIVAAISDASSAVGIYWGNAGATHDPKFFCEIAKERTTPSRLVLWVGVSIAREKGRYNLLSYGMNQFELPDLLLVGPPAKSDGAISFMLDLLGMVVEGGKPLPEGDTVGRTATEKLVVHYVPSPVDRKAKVWRVEMK
jgi:hypothetical protein